MGPDSRRLDGNRILRRNQSIFLRFRKGYLGRRKASTRRLYFALGRSLLHARSNADNDCQISAKEIWRVRLSRSQTLYLGLYLRHIFLPKLRFWR